MKIKKNDFLKIFITGAGSGLGKQASIALSKLGMHVFAGVKNRSQFSLFEKIIISEELKIEVFCCDILDKNNQKMLSELDVDILICNAAIGDSGSVCEVDIDRIKNCFNTNVFAHLEWIQAFIQDRIAKKKNGRIIIISSLVGRIPMPFLSPYCATKSALDCFATCLRQEMKILKKLKGIDIQVWRQGDGVSVLRKTSYRQNRKNMVKHKENLLKCQLGAKERRNKMPRCARKELESSYLHIIVQGINKEYIFEDIYLKNVYKNILKKNLLETNICILAYCIMDNHAHILLYSEEIDEIIKLMHKTNTSYARFYNKDKKRVGYVFRDRYYTQMILTERQLRNCLNYIHKNPVKAKMTDKACNYKFSSYNEYIGKKELITTKSIKLIFGTDKNYRVLFEEIHHNEIIEDIMDVSIENKEEKEVIKEFLEEKNKKLKEIVNDEIEFSELLLQLRHQSGLTLREMSSLFNINKDKLNRIINKSLK